ncbi:MAG: hypothetical protein E7497_02515 [Ruminococcus sp.]|nr:hypothetical protein [Ruminococcus sp.]
MKTNTKLFVLSVISIVGGGIYLLGGIIFLIYTMMMGEEISDNIETEIGALFALFGGMFWFALAIASAIALVLGMVHIISGILGIGQSKTRTRGKAIALIVINGIIAGLWLPSLLSFNLMSFAVIAVPVLFIVFCAYDLKEIKTDSRPVHDEYNPYYREDSYDNYNQQ